MKILRSKKIRQIGMIDFGLIQPYGGEFTYEPERKVVSLRLKNTEVDYNIAYIISVHYY